MERWWTVEEVSSQCLGLVCRMQREFKSELRVGQLAAAVVSMAMKGEIEIGERDGCVVLRDPGQDRRPNLQDWAKRFHAP